MSDTLGLSNWLTTLLRPPLTPPAPPEAPLPDAPLLVLPPMVHPNLLALLDRARAREATLWAERHAVETRLSVAIGALGLVAVGATVAMDRLAWGLGQWHSPWHVAFLAVPNGLLLALGAHWARMASRSAVDLLNERRFPFVSQPGLNDPLSAMAQNPDALFAATVQDLHASNNGLEVSLRKQQEKLAHLIGMTGRLGALLVLLAVFGTVGARWVPAASAIAVAPPAKPAAVAPAPQAPVAAAPVVAAPTPAASAIAPAAVPVSAASALPTAPARRRHRAHHMAVPAAGTIAPAAAPITATTAAPASVPAEAAPPHHVAAPAQRLPVAPAPAGVKAEAPAPRAVVAPARKEPTEPAARPAAAGHGVSTAPAEPVTTTP